MDRHRWIGERSLVVVAVDILGLLLLLWRRLKNDREGERGRRKKERVLYKKSWGEEGRLWSGVEETIRSVWKIRPVVHFNIKYHIAVSNRLFLQRRMVLGGRHNTTQHTARSAAPQQLCFTSVFVFYLFSR